MHYLVKLSAHLSKLTVADGLDFCAPCCRCASRCHVVVKLVDASLLTNVMYQVQFIAGITHAAQSIYMGCTFPLWMQWALIAYGASIFALFINFYFHSYIWPSASGTQVVVVCLLFNYFILELFHRYGGL